MASSLWLLRVVPAPDEDGRWDVVQLRTGRTIDSALTQDLAVQQALLRLPAGGAVEVVVDGFSVRREVVLPPPVHRQAMALLAVVALAVASLVTLVVGPLLHGRLVVTVFAALSSANLVVAVHRALSARRLNRARPDPASVELA